MARDPDKPFSSGQPTISDVARLARVSTGTVSHVLSNAHYVRPETRERVEQAIAALGYRPNKVAQALISQRTNTIGMIIPDVANPFFAEMLRGVEDVLSEAGYATIFGNSDNDPLKEEQYVNTFRDRRVDGMISAITTSNMAEQIVALGREVPMVIIDRMLPGWTGDCVVGDNRKGMKLSVEHMLGLGHRRIALVNGDPRLSTAMERRHGFEESLRNAGVEPVAISEGAFTLESGYDQAVAILGGETRPTAICAGNDLLAFGVLAAAADLGLRVPLDLSVAGYDDISLARLTSPALTSVRQPGKAMGEEAARLVLGRLSGEEGPGQQIVMGPELIVRKSTAERRPER